MQAYKEERCFLLLLLPLQGLVGFGVCFADFAELLVRTERIRGFLLSILLRKVSSRFSAIRSLFRVWRIVVFFGGGCVFDVCACNQVRRRILVGFFLLRCELVYCFLRLFIYWVGSFRLLPVGRNRNGGGWSFWNPGDEGLGFLCVFGDACRPWKRYRCLHAFL
jgi:hypothetical protein